MCDSLSKQTTQTNNRLFNPSIVYPEARSVLPSEVVVDGKKRRNLTLITKIVQNLSNQVDFGAKESYMIPLNELLDKYKSKNDQFLLECCSDDETMQQFGEQCRQNVINAINQQILTNDPSLLKEMIQVQTLIKQNEEKILREINGETELLTRYESVMSSLPPLEVVKPKKLPPVPTLAERSALSSSSVSTHEGAGAQQQQQQQQQFVDSESYKQLLAQAQAIDDTDLEALNILTFRGHDREGRPIMVFTEERVKKEDLERVLLYIVKKMDNIVERDYVMIWCVNNSVTQSRPGFNWLLNVYRSLSRKYKKNLKSFYLIHPTFMFKMLLKLFRPFVSDKFWKKLHMCDRVSQLYVDIDRDTLPLPPSVLSYDFLLHKDNTSEMSPVFGVNISEIMSRPENKGQPIPTFLRVLFEHIRKYGMHAQGLFRISGNATEANKIKILLNNGDNIDLCHCDIHTIGTVTKQFFREMPDPLFTYELYHSFLTILENAGPMDDPISNYSYVEPVKELLNKLPHVNYVVTKELFSLLVQVNMNSEENKMTSNNLAIVFGPNILRSRNENAIAALQDNTHVTRVVDFMIKEFTNLFMTQSMNRRARPSNVRYSTAVFLENFIHEDGASTGSNNNSNPNRDQ